MSCADVCLDMGYDDSNEFYSASCRVARKAHTCCECGETIQPKQRYEVVAGKSDGSMWNAKTCEPCLDIRQALVCGSWIFGALWEHIEEGVFPQWLITSPIDCLAKIDSLDARNKLRERFEDWRKDRT